MSSLIHPKTRGLHLLGYVPSIVFTIALRKTTMEAFIQTSRTQHRSPVIFTLNERQRSIVEVLTEWKESGGADEPPSLHILAQKPGVLHGTLNRANNREISEKAVLEAIDGRGRKQRLTVDEEKIIADAAVEFQLNVTTLQLEFLCDLTKMYVDTFSAERRGKIVFTNGRPGQDWLCSFLNRHSHLTLKRCVKFESERADEMSPQNIVTDFAQIEALKKKHAILDACRIFNFDKNGFYIRGMAIGRSNCVVKNGTRANMRDPMFKGTLDHVPLMNVVSATGLILTPLFPSLVKKLAIKEEGKVNMKHSMTFFQN